MKQNESYVNLRTPSQASCFISPGFVTEVPTLIFLAVRSLGRMSFECQWIYVCILVSE